MSSVKKFKLTQRDLQIPGLVENYHLLSTSQIKELLFPTLQKAQTRLKHIWEAGLVKRFQYPVLLVESGKGEYIYHYGRKPKMSYTGILHTLQLNDIRIAFELACKNSARVNMVGFVPEYRAVVDEEGVIKRVVEDVAMATNQNGSGQEKRFIPDAVTCLENPTNKKKILLFIELDLATEKLVSERTEKYSVMKKMMLYRDYQRQKGFERYNRTFDYSFKGFRVMIVMNNKRRIQILRKELTLRGIEKFVWFGEREAINQNTVFDEIWNIADIKEEKKHSILGVGR
ncbi:replication-relaxation family protein [bacterium]|nr:replication-relaxation family protein [bacterium]